MHAKRAAAMLMMLGVVALIAGCASGPGDVMEKVAYDFGMGEKPEGYVTGTDLVMANLRKIGDNEISRLNLEGRHGDVKFQDMGGLQGKYYKQVRRYEDAYPLDARALSKTTDGGRGYAGFIQYTYAVYESERFASRTEAANAPASIRTAESGRETRKYNFSGGGVWDGRPGEISK
jgi:hypothetical protein